MYLSIVGSGVLVNNSYLTSIGYDQDEADDQEESVEPKHSLLILTLAFTKDHHCNSSEEDVEKS